MPPDQFITYGIRIFGSHQLAERLLKFVPMKGTDPSGWSAYWNVGGPSDRRKTCEGSPTGAWMVAVARYSWYMMFVPVAKMSWWTTPKDERKTAFGWKFQASPILGAKLLRSLLASAPRVWTIAPVRPLTGSFAVGSNCDCCPYLVWKGVSYDQRRPSAMVRPRSGFQSSCT